MSRPVHRRDEREGTGRLGQRVVFRPREPVGDLQCVEVYGLDLTGTPLTIELWAKRASSGTWDGFVGQGERSSSNGLFFALGSDNVCGFSFYSGGLYTTNTYTDSEWHHWAATYDPVTGRCLYRDGVLIAADAQVNAYAGTGTLGIGIVPYDTNSGFDGLIDDIRIWNVARSQAEIASHMNQPLTGSETNLLAYWKFDETSGPTTGDWTGNGYTGRVLNEPQRIPSTTPFWWGSALYQRQFCAQLGVSIRTLQNWERGLTRPMRRHWPLLQGLCKWT